MTIRTKALWALIVCVLIWGLSFISIKIAVAFFGPMTLGALRFSIAVVFLFFIKKKLAPDEKMGKQDFPLLVGAALSGVTFYFFFENNGVSLISASEASIIVGAVPIITMIADSIGEKIAQARKKESGNDKEKISALHRIILPVTGAFISLAGVALVAGVSFAISGQAKGYMYMSGACVSCVCYCFLTRPLFARHSRIFIVFWQSAIGFIGFLPFTAFELASQASWQTPALYVWGNILFLGIFCSALGYWFYAQSLEVLGVGISALFINFIPVISAIGGFFILGERLRPLQWLGAGLVLAGVYLAMAAKKPRSLSGLAQSDKENAKKCQFLSIFFSAKSQRSP